MSCNPTLEKKSIYHVKLKSKLQLIILLIIMLTANSSSASQQLTLDTNKTGRGTKFHHEIITPTFWDLNQTHNVTMKFEIDDIANNIDIVEGEIGLHIKDDNNFTHYLEFHQFGPFLHIGSIEDYIRINKKLTQGVFQPILWDILNNQVNAILFDEFGKIVPIEYIFQFTIDLFLFDLIANKDPNKLGFYVSISLLETSLDRTIEIYNQQYVINDSYSTHKSNWEKVAYLKIMVISQYSKLMEYSRNCTTNTELNHV